MNAEDTRLTTFPPLNIMMRFFVFVTPSVSVLTDPSDCIFKRVHKEHCGNHNGHKGYIGS